MARDKHRDDATPPRVGQAAARSHEIHVCNGHCCEQDQKKLKPFQKVDHLLRAHGMVDTATAIHQTAIAQSPSSELHSAPATGSGAQALSNTGNNLQQERANEDPHWNESPAVRQFLLARSKMHQQMQEVSTMSPAQQLRTFDIQIATWPTFMEAVQHFPGACGVKYELSRSYQQYMQEAKVSIQELELGSRLFLADVLERCTDLAVQHLNGKCNRKLVEAEFVRAFKRSCDCNEAVQYVCKVFKEAGVPTPSWRQTVDQEEDTPRSLGAAYRMGQHEQTCDTTESKGLTHQCRHQNRD
jgi:hypothetical protein